MEHIADAPPFVMATIKEVVRDAENSKFKNAMNRVTQHQLPAVDTLYENSNILEGFNTFAEKRDPVWRGK